MKHVGLANGHDALDDTNDSVAPLFLVAVFHNSRVCPIVCHFPNSSKSKLRDHISQPSTSLHGQLKSMGNKLNTRRHTSRHVDLLGWLFKMTKNNMNAIVLNAPG